MSSIEVFVLSLFDVTMYYLIFKSIMRDIDIKKLRVLVFIVGGALTFALVDLWHINDIVDRMLSVASFFAVFVIFAYTYVKSFKSLVVGFSFITVIFSTVQILAIIALQLIFGKVEYQFNYGLIAQCIGLILVLILLRFTTLSSLFSYVDQKNKIVQSVLINMFAIYFVLSIMWVLNVQLIIQSVLLIFVVSLLIIFINIFLIRDGYINQKNKDKVDIYETYLPIINSIIEDVKIKQHDYHNQIQTTTNILKELDDKDVYYKYLNEVVKPDIWSKLIMIENKVLMAFLFSKYSHTKEKNIKLDFNIHNFLVDTLYTDHELIEMYGILIDNAVEAVDKIEDDERRFVQLELNWNEGSNILKVTNPVENIKEADVQKMFDHRHSTKGSGRGIGLTKLKDLLKSRNGNVSVHYDNKSKLIELEISHK